MIVGKQLYMANEQHIAECIDVETGKQLWQTRMPEGTIWASLVKAQDRLYVTNQNGSTLVFRPNPEKFELLAENKLGDQVSASPAVSGGRLYFRGFDALYAFGAK